MRDKYLLYKYIRHKCLLLIMQREKNLDPRVVPAKTVVSSRFRGRLLKQQSYYYDELESMAEKRWNETVFRLWKRSSIRDHVLGKDTSFYDDPAVFWQVTAGYLFEFLASIILEKDDHMVVVKHNDLHLDENQERKKAEELGLLDVTYRLGKEVLDKDILENRLLSDIPDSVFEKIIKHPLWEKFQKKTHEFDEQTSELLWQRFYKKYLRSNRRISEVESAEFEAIRSAVKKHLPLDLIAFTSIDSLFPRPFYFIEVKATKKNKSLLSLSSRSERDYIVDSLDKVPILLMQFNIGQEQVNLEYYEPLPY